MSDDRKRLRRNWIVCESTHRWQQSVWRFAPEWLAADELLAVTAVSPADIATFVGRLRSGVVLWEINDETPISGGQKLVSQKIAALGTNREAWVQVVAATRLSSRDRCALSEMGVAAFIRHPEDLPGLRQMVSGHFARSAGLLH